MMDINFVGFVKYIYNDPKLINGILLDVIIYLLSKINIVLPSIILKWLDFEKKNYDSEPILFIYGPYMNEIQVILIKWLYLHKYNVYTIRTDEWSAISLSIFKKIKEIYNQTNKPVCLVGHSIGGLIAAKYIKSKYVGPIIAISTPFRGAPLLKYVIYKDMKLRKILPSSEYLHDLHKKISEVEKIIYCIGSESDPIVPFPWCIAYTSRHNYNIRQSGHISILISSKLWILIDEIIRQNNVIS